MTCLVVIEFRTRDDCAEAVVDWVRRVLPGTRGADGCISVTMTRNQDDPRNFLFVEQWETRGHYERYFHWRTETGVLDELVAFVDGDANIRYFDYVGV